MREKDVSNLSYVDRLVERYKAGKSVRGERWEQYDAVTKMREMGLSWAGIGKLVGKEHATIRETHKRYQRWERLGYRGQRNRDKRGLKSYGGQ